MNNSKITEHQKQHTTFLFGKIKGMNNREAARLSALIPQNIGIETIPPEALAVYFQFAKEPNVDRSANSQILLKNGVERKSRSKLVMEYEKHRKLFKFLCKIRNTMIPAQVVDNELRVIVKNLHIQNFNNITIDDKFKIMELLKDQIKPN